MQWQTSGPGRPDGRCRRDVPARRDLITAIGDASIKGRTLEAAFRRISGPVNATIKLKIIRQKQTDPLVVAFAREAVPSHSVELQIHVADGKLVVEATGGW